MVPLSTISAVGSSSRMTGAGNISVKRYGSLVPFKSIALVAEQLSVTISIEVDSEPLIIDGNGDNVADLFGSVGNKKGIWAFR